MPLDFSRFFRRSPYVTQARVIRRLGEARRRLGPNDFGVISISFTLQGKIIEKFRRRWRGMRSLAYDVTSVSVDYGMLKVYTVIHRVANMSRRVAQAFYGMDWSIGVRPTHDGAQGSVSGFVEAGVAPILGYISGAASPGGVPYPIHEWAEAEIHRGLESGALNKLIQNICERAWGD